MSAVDPITPPPGYANTPTREGGTTPPDARSIPRDVPLRWDCGHLTTEHSRSEAAACRERQTLATAPPAHVRRRATDICAEAARLVGGSRSVAHGDTTLNFGNTAALWNALLEVKAVSLGHSLPFHLTALDVANFLEAFKIARRYSGSHNIDDYVDGAGYAGCAGEVAEKLNAKP